MKGPINRRNFLGAAAAVAAGMAATAHAAEPAPGSVKIIAISGSMRKGKSTSQALSIALESAKTVSPAISTELIELSGLNLDPYVAVGGKIAEGKTDDFLALSAKLTAPDVHGILLGSPVYMGMVSSPIKQMMERMVSFRRDFPLHNKVGGAIASGGGRNTGVELVVQQLVAFMLAMDMVVVGDGKPTSHWGGTVWNNQNDDISKDTVGIATVKGVGRHVAEIALKMAAQ